MRMRLVPAIVIIAVSGMTTTAQPPKLLKLPDGVSPESLADAKEAARVADLIDKQHPQPQPEGVRMLLAILRGSDLGGSDGWFGPAESRYSWSWLAGRFG